MVLDDKKLIFIHPPRCSGTSIEASFKWFNEENKHWSAQRIKRSISDDKWNSYFKFSIVRNPFDRAVSIYKAPIFRNDARGISFEQFLRNIPMLPNEDGLQCSDYINEPMDYIIKFETRSNDIKILKEKHSIHIDEKIVARKTNRIKDYRRYYNETTVQLVSEIFKDDIHNFDYTFETL